MSEAAPGATDIIEQPLTPEAAADRFEQLKTDPVFQERVGKLDAGAFAEAEKLWRVAHGLPAEKVMAVNTQDVTQQQSARAVAEAERRMALYVDKGFSAEVAYQIINGRPIPFEERQIHERELARLRNDQNFMQRYRSGDRVAILEHDGHVVARSLPVARSIDDIHAWETAHGRPLSK
jgi:hypothetical protein